MSAEKVFLTGLAGLTIYSSIYYWTHPASRHAANPTAASAVATSIDIEYAAKRAVRSALKDPDSAKFGPIYVSGPVACGTVNSRNSFGGMSGGQRFIVRPGERAVFEEAVSRATMQNLWRRLC